MASFYSDENIPAAAVERLRELGHDVLTANQAGKAHLRIPDEEVLHFAVHLERAVITLDRRKFVGFHLKGLEHCGIVVCTSDSDHIRLANSIHEQAVAVGSLNGKLIRVNRPNDKY